MCKLNEKCKEWKKWYTEDDNSVCAQIRDMLWDAAVFNVINEARKYATTQGKPELNELVHGLINRSFLKTQSLSIRKLYSVKNAFSLGRLIKDMENNSKLLTRTNILSAFELPYDYEEAIKEGHQTNNSKVIGEGASSDYIHKNVDLLTRVEPAQRQPSDIVRDGVFEQLNKWLGKCKPIADFVDKKVAHTTPSNRNLKISLAKIHKAHCRIIEIAVYIGRYILDEPTEWTNFLPSYAGSNKFEHFEKPWVRQEDIVKLEICWSQYEEHIEKLCKWQKNNNP